MSPISVFDESKRLLEESVGKVDPQSAINHLMEKKDTYELSVVTYFCASIDPFKNYPFGNPILVYEKEI